MTSVNFTTTKDFQFLLTKLEELHPTPFKNISKSEFEKQLVDLSTKNLLKPQLTLELMQILVQLNDSHTKSREIFDHIPNISFPFRTTFLKSNLYLISLEEENKEYIGSEITKINGLTVKQIIEKFSKVFNHENTTLIQNNVEKWIHNKEILSYLKITDSNKIELEVKTLEGNANKLKLSASDPNQQELVSPREESALKPETLTQKGKYWTKVHNDLNLYYLQYNECEDTEEKEIQDTIAEIKDSKLKYVVIDLRSNLGGSSLILDPLTKFLYENQDRYWPIILLSRNTFSAAIINALNALDGKNAISIGENTAGSPTKFGQTEHIELPESKIKVSISGKYFEEPGYSYGDPLVPKLEVIPNIKEYLDGKDVVWEKVLEVIKKES